MTAPGDAFLVCFFSVLPCVNRLFRYRLANMFTFGDQREHLLETDFMLFCQRRKIWIKFLGNILLKALGELNELLLAGPLMTTCGCSSCMYGSKIRSWEHPAGVITDWSRHQLVSIFLGRAMWPGQCERSQEGIAYRPFIRTHKILRGQRSTDIIPNNCYNSSYFFESAYSRGDKGETGWRSPKPPGSSSRPWVRDTGFVAFAEQNGAKPEEQANNKGALGNTTYKHANTVCLGHP